MAISSYYTPGRGGRSGLDRSGDCHRGGASFGQATGHGLVSETTTMSGSAKEVPLTICHR